MRRMSGSAIADDEYVAAGATILGDGTVHVTDDKGTFISPAIPGWQPFHLEKRTEYADKDTNVVIQDNYWELFGKLLVDPIVMFKALRRLEVRVLGDEEGVDARREQRRLVDLAEIRLQRRLRRRGVESASGLVHGCACYWPPA